ncbi:dienelactone hydrolase family protein [Immersiella caudata]|uniref:Dienelactone hydrolase family protein n=1 Tax=Immersiella caudata TaxID=314043 RepID=A0AA39WPG6_9PEZI|nr:dienelactone hydrolase family protein [Immersiella caudata]
MAAIPTCCLTSFNWSGTPTGITSSFPTLPKNPFYITGTNPTAAILLIHDLFGWTFPNLRLLADHYAREANATVYLPDFFGGGALDTSAILAERWAELDLPSFLSRNGREAREAEIISFAKELRTKHEKLGAVGFCYGGWAVHRLGAGEFVDKETGKGLVDCVTAGHPSLLTERDIEEVAVPVQVLAPEVDQAYTKEMKLLGFETLQRNGVPLNYVHFPGVEHGALVRGDETKKGEREAMARGKSAAVAWQRWWLHGI